MFEQMCAAVGVDLTGVDLGLLRPEGSDPAAGCEGSPPSPLGWLDPDRVGASGDALIEMCVVACRLEGWAASVRARAASRLCRSFENDHESVTAELGTSMAATEVGCATGHSPLQVEGWVRLADWLAQVPTARSDFVSGRLGWVKALAFRDCAEQYSPEVAEAVYRAERERSLARSSGQMRVRWNRALAKAQPEVLRERAETAHARREVRLLTRCNEPGMAGLLLNGPAPLILAAKQRLDDIADAVRAADPRDPRTLDAVRLDAALELLLQNPFVTAASPETFPTTGGAFTHDAGSSGAAAPATGHTPDGGAVARRWVRARRPAVVVTIPLSVLTGASQAPAMLAGYGPIPAQMARETASDAVWRCAVLDDDPTSATHGALLALGRSTYTPTYVPGEHARRFIMLRDGACRFPGCQALAAKGDLDHRLPYARGGLTCDCNLQLLCRRHHRLKHEGGVTVRSDRHPSQAPADGISWTLPSGRTYRTYPEPPPF